MTFFAEPTLPWSFAGCPEPSTWALDWELLLGRYPWLHELSGVPQDPQYHAEGDALIHTRMVAEALASLAEWQTLAPPARAVLFAAALLHDVAKPICTEIDAVGRVSSPRHARKGAQIARTMLWRAAPHYNDIPAPYREQIAVLVRHHGLPLWFLDQADPQHAIVAASQVVRLDYVALLAEADVRGRVCADQRELLARIELFREYCAELDCTAQPRPFASDHSRFFYFHSAGRDLNYAAYDDTRCEVIVMCGLPAAGKDTWIKLHCAGLPVVALDAIRAELDIGPTENPGPVAMAAKRQARELLQQGQPFVWNATNITRLLRRQLISFFTAYRARVRIVWVDASLATILRRNSRRSDPVPEKVIMRMLEKFEPPDLTEAHVVNYVYEH